MKYYFLTFLTADLLLAAILFSMLINPFSELGRPQVISH